MLHDKVGKRGTWDLLSIKNKKSLSGGSKLIEQTLSLKTFESIDLLTEDETQTRHLLI